MEFSLFRDHYQSNGLRVRFTKCLISHEGSGCITCIHSNRIEILLVIVSDINIARSKSGCVWECIGLGAIDDDIAATEATDTGATDTDDADAVVTISSVVIVVVAATIAAATVVSAVTPVVAVAPSAILTLN